MFRNISVIIVFETSERRMLSGVILKFTKNPLFISYFLLHNQPPQNLVVESSNFFPSLFCGLAVRAGLGWNGSSLLHVALVWLSRAIAFSLQVNWGLPAPRWPRSRSGSWLGLPMLLCVASPVVILHVFL